MRLLQQQIGNWWLNWKNKIDWENVKVMAKAVAQPEVVINVNRPGTRKPVFADIICTDNNLRNKAVDTPHEKAVLFVECILTNAVNDMNKL